VGQLTLLEESMALLSDNDDNKTVENEGHDNALPIKRQLHDICIRNRTIPSDADACSSLSQCKACDNVLCLQCNKCIALAMISRPKLTPFAALNNYIEPQPFYTQISGQLVHSMNMLNIHFHVYCTNIR